MGESSPLTAGALATYGKLRMNQGPAHHKEAAVLLTKALRIEVAVDSFHLQTAWELLQALKDLGMQGLAQARPTPTSSPQPLTRTPTRTPSPSP